MLCINALCINIFIISLIYLLSVFSKLIAGKMFSSSYDPILIFLPLGIHLAYIITVSILTLNFMNFILRRFLRFNLR